MEAFSQTLRCLKTWLRPTMAEDRLTGLDKMFASGSDITVTPDVVLDIFFRSVVENVTSCKTCNLTLQIGCLIIANK